MKRFIIASIAAGFLIYLVNSLLSTDVAMERKATAESVFLTQFKTMKPRAEKGEAKAQFIIARLYHDGKGVSQNFKSAAHWYVKAAKQGHATASYYLGDLYENGQGVKKNIFKAIEWYKLAVNMGANVDAQFALGQIHFKGAGVPIDYAVAFSMTLKAARQGHAAAQYLIGSMYQDGWSVKSNLPQAYMWYTLALPKIKETMAFDPLYNPTIALRRLTSRMNKFQLGKGQRMVKDYTGVR